MKEKNHAVLTAHVACVKNHAGYVREEDEFSTNPDHLYIGYRDTKEMTVDKETEIVDHNEVINRYIVRLKDITNRLKSATDAKVISKLNKMKASIIQSLFIERDFIEKIKKMKFQDFMASLER